MDRQKLEKVVLAESLLRGDRLYRVSISFPETFVFVARAALGFLMKLEKIAAVISVRPDNEPCPERVRTFSAFCSSRTAPADFALRVSREVSPSCSCSEITYDGFESELDSAGLSGDRGGPAGVPSGEPEQSPKTAVLHTLIFDYKALMCDFAALLKAVSTEEHPAPSSSRFEKVLMGLSANSARLIEFSASGREWTIPDCVVESFTEPEKARFWRTRGAWFYQTPNMAYPVYGLGAEPDWKRIISPSGESAGILIDYNGRKVMVLAERLGRRTTVRLADVRFMDKGTGASYLVSCAGHESRFLLPSAL